MDALRSHLALSRMIAVHLKTLLAIARARGLLGDRRLSQVVLALHNYLLVDSIRRPALGVVTFLAILLGLRAHWTHHAYNGSLAHLAYYALLLVIHAAISFDFLTVLLQIPQFNERIF